VKSAIRPARCPSGTASYGASGSGNRWFLGFRFLTLFFGTWSFGGREVNNQDGLATCRREVRVNHMNRFIIPVLLLLVTTGALCQSTDTSSVIQYLTDSSAADFHAHGPSKSIRFRHVRFGHVMAPDGKEQYLLCGELNSDQKTGKWVRFATIKTSGYEQSVGHQATDLCKRKVGPLDSQKDLSSLLQNRFDALQ
jgi:hypothetical protein